MAGEQYLGFALNAVDAKLRVSVPTAFREIVSARSVERELIVGPSEYDDCLVAYDPAHAERLRAEIETRYAGDYTRERSVALRRAFGNTTRLKIDDAHRITLTPVLKDLLGVERFVYFLGAGEYFEIWNPQVLLAVPDLDPATARILKREIDAKGAAA